MRKRDTYRERTMALIGKVDALEDAADTFATRHAKGSGWSSYERRSARRSLVDAAIEVGAAARGIRRRS